MRKRFLATLLALAMVLSVTPFALATSEDRAGDGAEGTVVATVGDMKYTSLTDAITNANGKEVVLQNNVVLSEAINLRF